MKKALILIYILSFFFSFITPVSADGGIIVYDGDMWDLANEEKQYCAINHKNGIQNMLLKVDTGEDLTGEKAVWIFPVPAKPENTAIDIMKGFPYLNGEDIEKETEDYLHESSALMSMTQIYTIPYFFLKFAISTTGSILEGVTVHGSIEKMGLKTELVSARDSSSMEKYIKSKKLEFPKEIKSLIDEYIGKEYSFIVSWISDIEAFKKNQKKEKDDFGRLTRNSIGVFVTFPTEKLYYPLKLTSVYGEKVVPTVIYAFDHVKPELYDEIEPFTKTNYYLDKKIVVPEELSDFFAGYKKNDKNKELVIENVEYTKIKIDAPSSNLNQDLWMENSAPTKITIANSIIKFKWIIAFFLFILYSCLASLLSGLITFRKKQISKKKLAFFGLWNFLTLIGLSIAASKNNALKIAQLRTYHKNNFWFLRIIILSALVFVVTSIVLIFQDIPYGYHSDPRTTAVIYIKSTLVALSSMVLIGGYYSNKKIVKFIIIFTFFFVVLTIIIPKVTSFLI